VGGNGVPGAGGNQDGVAGADRPGRAVDFHFAGALKDEVKLLREPVVMSLGGAAGGDPGLGEGLLLDRRIRAVEDAADGGAVLGGERRLIFQVEHGHGGK
jgi:hypothetical protein